MPELTVYPTDSARAGLILAPGAGAGQQHPFMVGAARALAERGLVTATFDFPYRTAGRSVPDKAEVLERTWVEAMDAASRHQALTGLPLFAGGKSMGGRIASQAAAANPLPIKGLVFLGYPLHPPGKPAQRRDAHLPSVPCPMLFVQGTRDSLGTADEIRALLPRLTQAELFVVEEGDHSFKVPARVAKAGAVMNAVYDRVAMFIGALA